MKRPLLFLLGLFPLLAAGEIKLVTYNIRQDTGGDRGVRDWSKRAPGVVAFLKAGGFSIVGLQEARHNQVEDIQKGLEKFVRLGVGRDDGKQAGEYSPIFYDPALWKPDPKEQGTFWLSDTPAKPGSMTWGNRVTRICTWVRLRDEKGRGLYVFNTHWDHQSQNSREKAARLILARIKARAHPDEPVVLMGDFNATIDNPAVETLLDSGVLVDPGADEQKLTFNYWKPGLREGLRIDHLFVSPALDEGKLKVLSDGDPVNSDHHPVTLTLPSLGAD